MRIESTLVHFDSSVNSLHEPQTGEEANGAGQHEECDGNHGHVGEVEDSGNYSGDVQLRHEIPHWVQEKVQSRRPKLIRRLSLSVSENGMGKQVSSPRRQVRAPPPSVIFVAELEVAHDDRDLSASEHQDHQNHEKESEDEVQLSQEHSLINNSVIQPTDTCPNLMQPHGRHDEEKLDANGAEG